MTRIQTPRAGFLFKKWTGDMIKILYFSVNTIKDIKAEIAKQESQFFDEG